MTVNSAYAANLAWLKAAFAGNIDFPDGALKASLDAPATFPGQATFNLRWKSSRTRGSTVIDRPPPAEQVDTALKSRSPADSLIKAAALNPTVWMTRQTGREVSGWRFENTCRESCDSCSGRGKVNCGGCGATGRVQCHNCSGSGTQRQSCHSCGGQGRHARTRSYQVWVVNMYETRYETVYENCWSCSSRGYTDVTCRTCGGARTVSCSKCRGSGSLTCSDCSGAGKRLYLYSQWLEADSLVDLTLKDVGTDEHRLLIDKHWNPLCAGAEVVVRPGVGKISQTGQTVTTPFEATTTLFSATIEDNWGAMTSVGHRDPYRMSTPILGKALNLTQTGKDPDWVEEAGRLAGKRILKEAITAFDANRGPASDRQAAVRTALNARYSVLLGDAAAAAVASAAALGVGGLRKSTLTRVWGAALAGAALSATGVCAWLIASILKWVETQGARDISPVQLWAAPVLGVVIGVGAAIAARVLIKRLAASLDLGASMKAPGGGKLAWSAIGVAALTPALTVAGFLACVFFAWPEGLREGVNARLGSGYASPLSSRQMATTTALRLRAGPSTSARAIVTLPEGSHVTLQGASDGEWVAVSYRGRSGYVAARYLRPIP